MTGNAPPAVLKKAEDLSLDVVEQVAWEGRTILLHPHLLDELADVRARMEEALADGREVYGVTTGMGYLAGVTLTAEEQRHHQANLFLGRAVGGPPYLDRGEARALLAARLASFLGGPAAVTPQLCAFLADRLNDDFVPAIPRTGIGCAGEIIPLAHAFGPFLGIGQVLKADGAPIPAAAALTERAISPYQPAAKEGIALLAGAPGAVALGIAHRRNVALLSRQLLAAAACAIDALRAPLDPYDPAIARLGNDPVMASVLEHLNGLLAGSSPDRQSSQAPVSFRVIPQVLTHLETTLQRVTADLTRALLAVTDSPAFYDGRFLTSGAFHAVGLTADIDNLGLCLIQAVELAGQHIHRLLDHRFSGLPDQLTSRPGPNAGLVAVHKRVVGSLHELRALAAPSGIGLFDTSMGQEDAMSFEFEAADKLRRVELLVREVLACELLICRQAWALRRMPVAEGLTDMYGELCEVVDEVAADRPLGADISALISLLESGRFQSDFDRPASEP